MALIILNASSVNLSIGLPTHRITFLSRSPLPSNSSTRPFLSLYAMALIVKSRRFRSSTRLRANSTLSGCLPSLYSPSILYVVTSYPVFPIITVTVPCFSPVSTVLPNMDFTCIGRAEVVISQSLGVLPMRVSLTHPPTA